MSLLGYTEQLELLSCFQAMCKQLGHSILFATAGCSNLIQALSVQALANGSAGVIAQDLVALKVHPLCNLD